MSSYIASAELNKLKEYAVGWESGTHCQMHQYDLDNLMYGTLTKGPTQLRSKQSSPQLVVIQLNALKLRHCQILGQICMLGGFAVKPAMTISSLSMFLSKFRNIISNMSTNNLKELCILIYKKRKKGQKHEVVLL